MATHCAASDTLYPVFFLLPGEHTPVPGFQRIVVGTDCSRDETHLDADQVDYGVLHRIVNVTYTINVTIP